jgi:hypothetical protein
MLAPGSIADATASTSALVALTQAYGQLQYAMGQRTAENAHLQAQLTERDRELAELRSRVSQLEAALESYRRSTPPGPALAGPARERGFWDGVAWGFTHPFGGRREP